MSAWMKDPNCYKMLKEKSDGLILGALKFPILFADTIYLLPKDAGDALVAGGYAISCEHLKDITDVDTKSVGKI